MKDVESVRPKEIHIAAVRPRGDVRDRIVGAESIEALKKGAMVGTSSPRRAAQLLRLRPDLKIVPMRGNVETRLKKVEAGEVDATLLAAAGLKRLDIERRDAIPTEIMLPAPGQAVIGMECRTNDTETQSVLTHRQQPDHLWLRDGRAGVHSRARRDLRFAGRGLLPCSRTATCGCAAQLFSEDGSEMVEDRAVFDCGDDEAPAKLARDDAGQGARIDPEAVRSAMRRVLVLRPEPGASATVERARRLGLDAVAIPLFEIEPVAWASARCRAASTACC